MNYHRRNIIFMNLDKPAPLKQISFIWHKDFPHIINFTNDALYSRRLMTFCAIIIFLSKKHRVQHTLRGNRDLL